MTSEPKRDPLTDPLLTPENSALIVIDYQPSQLAAVNSMDRELLTRNIVSRLIGPAARRHASARHAHGYPLRVTWPTSAPCAHGHT